VTFDDYLLLFTFNNICCFNCDVKIITGQRSSVLDLWLIWVKDQWVGGLDMVVNEITWQDTSLTLRKVEAWKFIFHSLWIGLRIIDIKDTSSQS